MPYVNTAREVRAMVTQLERVNGTERAAAADPVALRHQLADAKARILKLERELSEMRLLLAAYEDSAPLSVGGGAGMTWHGAQRITAKEAAQMMGVSLSTVSRYCESGFWRADQDASGRWLIDASQKLQTKQRRSVATKRPSSAKSTSRK